MHPEQYILPPTPHVPNSPLPVLVYRNVLPPSLTVDSVQKFIERNGWKRQVGTFPRDYLSIYLLPHVTNQGPNLQSHPPAALPSQRPRMLRYFSSSPTT